MGTSARTVFGPNDFHMEAGQLMPGLGESEEARIRESRGLGVPVDEPPAKAELRAKALELQGKARQLSAVERELEKERAAMESDLTTREAALAAREALIEKQLKDLENGGA